MEGKMTTGHGVCAMPVVLAALGILVCAGCREILEYQDTTQPGSQTPIVWERTNGPAGEAILSLRVDQDGVLYAGSESGRLFRSITDGNDWTPVAVPFPDGAVTAIITDQLRRLYVANEIHGIFESTDGGAAWFGLNDGLGDSSIYALAFLPGGALIAGSARGYVSTSTGGNTLWTSHFSLARPVTSLLVLSSADICAGTWGAGVYRFGEGDSTARDVNPGLQDPYVNVLYSGGTGFLFAGTRSAGLFRSDPDNIFWQSSGGGSLSREIAALKMSQYGEMFAGTSNGIFYSTDAGTGWTALSGGIGSREVRALAINENARVFAGTADGVWRSVRLRQP
jgi:ligand-binding sensor domain-containing protein